MIRIRSYHGEHIYRFSQCGNLMTNLDNQHEHLKSLSCPVCGHKIFCCEAIVYSQYPRVSSGHNYYIRQLDNKSQNPEAPVTYMNVDIAMPFYSNVNLILRFCPFIRNRSFRTVKFISWRKTAMIPPYHNKA